MIENGRGARRSEILIAGLGSAGRRHLRNLHACGWTDIRLFRTGQSTLPDHELAPFPAESDLDTALAYHPSAVVVANPTALHLPIAIAGARAGAHLLIEKPVSHSLAGLCELETLVETLRLQVLVGFQLRFNPGLHAVKTWLADHAVGTVVCVQVQWGEYLPDMHPWEDYRRGYAARVELGGGVLLTLCHPFDYLRWLMGEMTVVGAATSETAALDVAVDASADVTVQFEGGASGHIHLDYLRRPARHQLEIVGTEGLITWNHEDHVARLYRAGSREWQVVSPPAGFTRNDMFLAEMRHFLACIRGEATPICTLRDGRAALDIVLAARRALTEPRLTCNV